MTANVDVAGDGVIIAQGGTSQGWAIYVQDGTLRFATTVDNKRTVIDSKAGVVGKQQIYVSMTKKGILKMLIGGKEVAKEKLESVPTSQPQDGLQVGRDTGGQVGDYKPPFELDGKVEKVLLKVN